MGEFKTLLFYRDFSKKGDDKYLVLWDFIFRKIRARSDKYKVNLFKDNDILYKV